MDDIRQSRIQNLKYLITANEIISESGVSFIFYEGKIIENGVEGKIKVDKKFDGFYKILFGKKLTLFLKSNGTFNFSNIKNRPSNSIAIEGIDTNSILELIKLVNIDY